MFAIIILVFILMGLIAFYGDYAEKEMKEDYKKYEEMVNNGLNR